MSLKEQLQILLVDDTSVSRMLIANALDELGLRNYTYAKGGDEALQLLMSSPRHLVISDMNMPGMDGLGLLKALRGYKPTSRIGFILVTGSADKSLIAQGRQYGLNNFVSKPFTTATMRTAIEAVVGRLT